MMGRLFGKDGIKGLAVTELTCELAVQIGRAAAEVLAGDGHESAKILIGKDTRSSADTIEAALCAGICSAGVDAELLGIVPAPAAAYLAKEREAAGSIMITASYRNAEFSGIRFFSSEGKRLGLSGEEEIERLVLDAPQEIAPIPRRKYGSVIRSESAIDEYIDYIKTDVGADLSGIKVAIDCANGSACRTARRVFTELGADIVLMGNRPDGTNINKDCGCTFIEPLMEFTRSNGCSCGIALDGSGERCIAVDENGRIIDGDEIIAICAGHMKEKGLLRHNTIVTTSANNLGLMQFARSNDIYTVTAPANERSTIRKLTEGDFCIAGDPGGYIVFPDVMLTGDGQLTAVKLLEVLKDSGRPMSGIAGVVKKIPQVMLNVRIDPRDREIWKNDRTITRLIDEYEGILGDDGRVIVREISRDSQIRIMVEGEDFTTINAMAVRIADTIRERCSR
ncbi:hypothetical protein [Ruminococcus sp. XPD3002]|uniref:hypothetical protein n=1 Tax=Ruminococcus sp. XPD3002 TaxID=1452269 RepID=UPI0009EBE2CB